MGLVCGNTSLRKLRLIVAILSVLFLFTGLILAQDEPDQGPSEAPESWTENLFSFEPVRIDSSVLEHQIEITVHCWGAFTETQNFTLAVEDKPGFMKQVWWNEGETLAFTPDETEKVVHLRFDLVEAGNASGDLVFAITAEDAEKNGILPPLRRFKLPFGFGREEGEGCAYLLKEDAPDKIDPNELHEWIDPEIKPIYACDKRVAVFFTPSVDLEADQVSFRWCVLPPVPEPNKDAETLTSKSMPTVDLGIYAPPDGVMHRELGINPFPNIPGKFISELPTAHPMGSWRDQGEGIPASYWDSYAGWMPGPFRIETAVERESESSLFGVKGSVPGEFTEVATFEFKRLPELKLAGIRTDPPQNVNLGELEWCHDGTLRMSASGSGRLLRLDMEASYRRVHLENENAPEKDRHKASFKATIELPEVLKLGQNLMGEGKVTCEEFSQGPAGGYGSIGIRAYAGLGDFVALSDRQPGDWMIFAEELPQDMGSAFIHEGPDAPILDGCPFSDSKMLFIRIPEWDSWTFRISSWGLRKSGSPERALGFHLRDPATQFVLPIRFSFPKRVEGETYEVFSYVIYKVKGP